MQLNIKNLQLYYAKNEKIACNYGVWIFLHGKLGKSLLGSLTRENFSRGSLAKYNFLRGNFTAGSSPSAYNHNDQTSDELLREKDS